MTSENFETEQFVIINSVDEIDCLDWARYFIVNWKFIMKNGSRLLVLAGVHGDLDGLVRHKDSGLLNDIHGQIERLKEMFKDDIKKKHIEIILLDVGKYLNCSTKNLKRNQIVQDIKQCHPTIISLAFCFTNRSVLNSVLRSSGLYADLFTRHEYSNLHDDTTDIGKLIKFNNAQKQVEEKYFQNSPGTVFLTGHYGTGKTLVLVNLLQMKISQLSMDNVPFRVIVTADIPYHNQPMLFKVLKEKYLQFIERINCTKRGKAKIELIMEPLSTLVKKYHLIPDTNEHFKALQDMVNLKNKGYDSMILNHKGWIPFENNSISCIIFELCKIQENYQPNENYLLEKVNVQSRFQGKVSAKWLWYELKECIQVPNFTNDIEAVCVATIRLYRQNYLLKLFMEWYATKKNSSFILDKLIENLKNEKNIHTVLFIDQFDAKLLPIRNMNMMFGEESMGSMIYDQVDVLISFAPLHSPPFDEKIAIHQNGGFMYCHLPTKYRISHDLEYFVVNTMKGKFHNNLLMQDHMENYHHRLPRGHKPLWISITDLKDDEHLLKDILRERTSNAEDIIVLSRFKFHKYELFCEEMNWHYANMSDVIGSEISCIILFGIPTTHDWESIISRARHVLIIITEKVHKG